MSTELQALLDRRCLSSWHMAPALLRGWRDLLPRAGSRRTAGIK